jgi:hypothetical protein
MQLVEPKIFEKEQHLYEPAMWTWTLFYNRTGLPTPAPLIFDRFLFLWLADLGENLVNEMAAHALGQLLGLPRDSWRPVLTDEQRRQVRQDFGPNDLIAACVIAFHDRNIWSDDELARKLGSLEGRFRVDSDRLAAMLKQLEVEKKVLVALKREMYRNRASIGHIES